MHDILPEIVNWLKRHPPSSGETFSSARGITELSLNSLVGWARDSADASKHTCRRTPAAKYDNDISMLYLLPQTMKNFRLESGVLKHQLVHQIGWMPSRHCLLNGDLGKSTVIASNRTCNATVLHIFEPYATQLCITSKLCQTRLCISLFIGPSSSSQVEKIYSSCCCFTHQCRSMLKFQLRCTATMYVCRGV